MTDETLAVALGEQRYAVERHWGRLPGDMTFGFISQVAADSSGNVYLLQRGDPPVLVFDPSGAFIKSWGADLIADGHGIYIDAEDRVFIVDRDAHQVLVCDADGALLFALGERHRPRLQAPFNHPTDAAVASDGEIYVSDGYGNTAVHRFSAAGEHLQTWGETGSGPGELLMPHSIWIDQQDRVLVADRENNRVQLFSRDGAYLDTWTGFHKPMDLFGDARGMIYVSDQVPRITMVAPDGSAVGRGRGTISGGHGIWGDRDGNLFIAELPPMTLTRLRLLDDSV